ncbi:Clp protease ClpP [Tenacibaculum maritimum]|nr:Clp protease ClpP [Tenacibaculum maritimum]MDB0600698.1 Clp protease ClpP [Tenacibaculum maritimum]MDB0612681.1 Clp protease ClpP [Tenacibaculum maritimum]
MPNNFTIINQIENKKAVIMLTGVVSSYDSDHTFKASTFINEFTKLQESNTHIHVDIVNFYGGSIMEGIPVYNHIKKVVDEGVIEISGKVDGLAASMGSIISMAIPVENLEMANMARLMNHCAKGGAWGTAAEVRNTAQLIEDLENDLVNILAERTGWTPEEVKNKWMDGLDHYITATEAKKIGLVGETTKSKVIKKEPKNLVDPAAVFNFYQNQITNISKPEEHMKNIPLFIAAFAAAGIELSANVDEAGILSEVKKLATTNKTISDKLTEAETKLGDQQKLAVDNLVNNAIKDQKIDKSQEESIRKMATSNFDSAKTFLDGQTARKPLNGQLNGGGNPPNTPGNQDPEKNFSWYRKNAPNALAKMKRETPEDYEALKNAQYTS